jgi:hypothetical protein
MAKETTKKFRLPAQGKPKPKPKKTSARDLGKVAKDYMSDKDDNTLLKSKMSEAKKMYKTVVDFDKAIVNTPSSLYKGKDKFSKDMKSSVSKAAKKQSKRTGV